MQNLTTAIETWIHEVCTDSEQGPCKAIALVHMAGTVQEDVYQKTLPDKFSAEQISDWADLFTRKAEQYAEGLPGTQTFSLLSFHGDLRKPGIRKTFPVRGFVEQDGLLTENPTGKGVLQQMMRLVDTAMGQLNRNMATMSEMFLRKAESDARENIALRRENVTMFDFSKDLVLKLSDRTHEQRLAQIQAQSTADIQREIGKTVPLLINSATGREVIPQNAHDSLLLERMIDAIAQTPPDQMMNLSLKDFPPQLLAALADRFQKGMAARQKEQAIRKTVEDADGPIDGGLQ